MTGLLASQGIRVSQQRVGESLQRVNPGYQQARRTSTARKLNPIPYHADYFGHKLHIDQNEKLVMFSMVSLAKDTRIPLGLKRLLRDSFRCRICHIVPIRPPLIIGKCCKAILGCGRCVNSWYSGPDALAKPCPNCRYERGYNETMLLRTLDILNDSVNICGDN